jgi:hypothetical protein
MSVSKSEYNLAKLTMKTYEAQNGLYSYDEEGGIPFSEFSDFTLWMQDEGWYEAAVGEFDKNDEHAHFGRLTIKELFLVYKESKDEK